MARDKAPKADTQKVFRKQVNKLQRLRKNPPPPSEWDAPKSRAARRRRLNAENCVPLSKRALSITNNASSAGEANQRRQSQDDNGAYHDQAINETLGFCCAVCKCDQEDVDRYGDEITSSGDNMVYHRHCCHRIENPGDTYAGPYETVATTGIDVKSLQKSEDPPSEWVTFREVTGRYSDMCTKEAQVNNSCGKAHSAGMLFTSEKYRHTIVRPFKRHVKNVKQNKIDKRRITVVDAFAGVGTSIVCLKRLGIDIEKIIHIEHDQVATHVYRHQHDAKYNPELATSSNSDGDEIEHVYIKQWEDVVGEDGISEAERIDKITAFFREHGPFDLVIGGPPCSDYSGVNATAQGVEGKQGSYLTSFASVVRRWKKLQEADHPMPEDYKRTLTSLRPLYFLAENVHLNPKDRDKVMKSFGFDWDPIDFDALYVSPTSRDRDFIMNFPAGESVKYDGKEVLLSPNSCLEENYHTVVELLRNIIKRNKKSAKQLSTQSLDLLSATHMEKSSCFMASMSRLDQHHTLRMYAFYYGKNGARPPGTPKSHKWKYQIRPFTVLERERMMGFPEGYTGTAVNELFHNLLKHGLEKVYTNTEPGARFDHWRLALPEKYHCFAGRYTRLPKNCSCAYRFWFDMKKMEVWMEMAAPLPYGNKTVSYFSKSQYAKHLIGNAFSVPVVTRLLKPLQKVFKQRTYPGYDYDYAWSGDACLADSDSDGWDSDNLPRADTPPAAAAMPNSRDGSHAWESQELKRAPTAAAAMPKSRDGPHAWESQELKRAPTAAPVRARAVSPDDDRKMPAKPRAKPRAKSRAKQRVNKRANKRAKPQANAPPDQSRSTLSSTSTARLVPKQEPQEPQPRYAENELAMLNRLKGTRLPHRMDAFDKETPMSTRPETKSKSAKNTSRYAAAARAASRTLPKSVVKFSAAGTGNSRGPLSNTTNRHTSPSSNRGLPETLARGDGIEGYASDYSIESADI